jgi:type III secretion protein J
MHAPLPRPLRLAGAAALLLALAACREPMFSDLAERDANEIVAALRDHGISAVKVPGAEHRWGLEVGSDDFSRAVQVLKENGLPRPSHASIGELFRKEGLVSTPSEERIRFVFAQQQELESTLSRIDGVVSARVHVVMPQSDPLADTPRPASASVFIKHRADVDLTASVPQIKALVARSIESLPHENVTLSLFPARGGAAPAPAPAVVADTVTWRGAAWVALAALAGGALGVLGMRARGRPTARKAARDKADAAAPSRPSLAPVPATSRQPTREAARPATQHTAREAS